MVDISSNFQNILTFLGVLSGIVVPQWVIYKKNKSDREAVHEQTQIAAKIRMGEMMEGMDIKIKNINDNLLIHVAEEDVKLQKIADDLLNLNTYILFEQKVREIRLEIIVKAQNIITLNNIENIEFNSVLLAFRDSVLRLSVMILQIGIFNIKEKWINTEIHSIANRLQLHVRHHIGQDFIIYLSSNSNLSVYKEAVIYELMNISTGKFNGSSDNQFKVCILDFMEKIEISMIDTYRRYLNDKKK